MGSCNHVAGLKCIPLCPKIIQSSQS
jgi:hypothetical protein